MSILFADIRSFTAISERLSPSENFRFVNDFLQEIGPCIRQRGGYIDKFLGDGVMALFDKSASDAIHAAIDIQKKIRNFNERQVASGGIPITIGIGINTGRMMLGTLGEADRMEGSVISDSVNLASRLESLTKVYGSRVLVSEETMARANDHDLNFRFVDRVIVKGKSDPVSVFEVLNADDDAAQQKKMELLDRYERALEIYRKKEFTAASSAFEALHSVAPDDMVIATYARRCERFLRDGFSDGEWDGVMRLQEK
jgi:class 3 adenylate cyclase